MIYNFNVVPENTLRVVITQLDDDYAIARLLDFKDIPGDFKEETLLQFSTAIIDMGFAIWGVNDFFDSWPPGHNILPHLRDRYGKRLARVVEQPALLIKKVELK